MTVKLQHTGAIDGLVGTFVIFYAPMATLVIACIIGREGRF